jgi:hypothetical protein
MTYVHNEYLEILVERGLFGLLLWIYIIIKAIINNIRILLRSESWNIGVIGSIALLAAIVGIGMQAIVNNNLHSAPVMGLFFLYLGCSWFLGGAGKKSFKEKMKKNRIGTKEIILMILLVLISFQNEISAIRHTASEYHLKKGIIAYNSDGSESNTVTDAMNRSLSFKDDNLRARYFLMLNKLSANDIAGFREAERIEEESSMFLNVPLIVAEFAIQRGMYGKAISSLSEWVKHDWFDDDPYIKLVACFLVTGNEDESLSTIKDFFINQNRFFNANKGGVRWLPEAQITFSDDGFKNFGHLENSVLQATISSSYITRMFDAVRNMTNNEYEHALRMIYFYIGRIYEEISYGDIELQYYMKGIEGQRGNSDPVRHVLSRNVYFLNRALSKSSDEPWVEAAIRKYGKNILRINPDYQLPRKVQNLLLGN